MATFSDWVDATLANASTVVDTDRQALTRGGLPYYRTDAQLAAGLAAHSAFKGAFVPASVVLPSGDTSAVTDTAALLAALTATGNAYLGVGTFYLGPLGTISQNNKIEGAARNKTNIFKVGNGDFATLNEGVEVSNLTVDGQGATYTGRGFVVTGVNGDQRLSHVDMLNFDGYCLEFTATTAGSGIEADDCTMYRTSAGSGTGRYAVKVADAVQLGAVPRVFTKFKTGGQCAIDFGGCNDFYVTSSTVGDLLTSANTRGLHIANSRLLSVQTTFNWAGHNSTLVGCDIYPQVILTSGADGNVIGPNSYNGGGLNSFLVIDNSGNDRNQVFYQEVDFTAAMGLALDSNGTAPSLGNGTLTARAARHGTNVTVTYNLTVGSTTTFGNGNWGFVLPVARVNGVVAEVGPAVIYDSSANAYYTCAVQIVGPGSKCSFIRDTSGGVSGISPITFATGDTVRTTFTYPL